MKKKHSSFILWNQAGVTLLETSMLIALIAVICVPSLSFVGKQTESRIRNTGVAIGNTGTGSELSGFSAASGEGGFSDSTESDDSLVGMGGAEGEGPCDAQCQIWEDIYRQAYQEAAAAGTYYVDTYAVWEEYQAYVRSSEYLSGNL